MGNYNLKPFIPEGKNSAERERIGRQIARLRLDKGYSPQVLADRSGVTSQNIKKIEKGRYNVSIDILTKITEALGVRINIGPIEIKHITPETAERDYWLETTSGAFICYDPVWDEKANPEDPSDLIGRSDKAYAVCQWPTLAEMKVRGELVEKHAYDEFMVRCPKASLSDEDIAEIVAKFKGAGFDVTPEAIRHNYVAWCGDYKSGYRDEANGYHLFSPCGCNDLTFTATTLCPLSSWQKTYIC